MPRRVRRVSGGRVEAWRAATDEVSRFRRQLAALGAFFLGVAVVVNLPWFPSYPRGLVTGFLAASTVWAASWIVWVSSGLALRLNGIWAEDATVESVRRCDGVLDVIPSLKFEDRDIDVVAVTASAVFAIEAKWQLQLREGDLEGHCYTAAKRTRTLKHLLRGRGLPDHLLRPILVVWGPGSRELGVETVRTPFMEVVAIPGMQLEQWFADLPTGPIGTDYGRALAQDLHAIAQQRDEATVTAGRVLRYLARVR